MSRSWMIGDGSNEPSHGILEVAGSNDPLILGDAPGTKFSRWQNISVADCSPRQCFLAAVPAGFYHLYAYAIFLLGLTPCALNRLPHHDIQAQSQKIKGKVHMTAVAILAQAFVLFVAFFPRRFGTMPLSQLQLEALKNPATIIQIQPDNPKKTRHFKDLIATRQ